jgi:hypothetical protein
MERSCIFWLDALLAGEASELAELLQLYSSVIPGEEATARRGREVSTDRLN